MILDTLTTFVASGGLGGAISGLAALGAKLYEKKLDQRHEIAMQPHERERWRYEATLHRLNAERDRVMAENELLIETERAAGEALEKSITADMAETVTSLRMMGQKWWVGALRTLNRPALTWGALALTSVVWFTTDDPAHRALIVAAILNLALTSYNWWFAGRVIKTDGD